MSIGWTPVTIAMIVVARMLMISAARILSAYRMNVMARPMMKTSWPIVVGNDERRRAATPTLSGVDDQAAVDEADEQDEQADADADRSLERAARRS